MVEEGEKNDPVIADLLAIRRARGGIEMMTYHIWKEVMYHESSDAFRPEEEAQYRSHHYQSDVGCENVRLLGWLEQRR
jgi:hypothetical protein